MIFDACINLPTSSHVNGMYPHGSPILWYIQMYCQHVDLPGAFDSPWVRPILTVLLLHIMRTVV